MAEVFPRLLVPGLDYTLANALHRMLGQIRQKARLHDRTARIAVLGSFTTHPLAALLELFLAAGRVGAEIYEADYGTLRQEILDPDSGLYRSRPDFLVVATTWRDLGHRPELSDDRGVVGRKVEAEAAEWTSLWGIAHDRLGCQIIQNNFDAPPWRALGNLEATHPAGFGRYVSLVNHALQDAAPPYVTIHDVDHLAAAWGRWEWGDERFYHQAKLPCSPEHLVDYCAQPRLADPRPVGAGQEMPGPRPGQHALGRRDRRRRPGGYPDRPGGPRERGVRRLPAATPGSSAGAA